MAIDTRIRCDRSCIRFTCGVLCFVCLPPGSNPYTSHLGAAKCRKNCRTQYVGNQSGKSQGKEEGVINECIFDTLMRGPSFICHSLRGYSSTRWDICNILYPEERLGNFCTSLCFQQQTTKFHHCSCSACPSHTASQTTS